MVDISFDTLGGLCTVAFLESIDRHIGKQHLFKRSVILVCIPAAAWIWIPMFVSVSLKSPTVRCLRGALRSYSMLLQVKAWCYYESRLLGAHHGLLSTYALETMVLYIFNMYHHELQSPLKVRISKPILLSM